MYSFLLFKPSDRKEFPSILKWIFLFILLSFLNIFSKYLPPFLHYTLLLMVVLLAGHIVYFLATNYKRFYFIKGTFYGKLSFSKDGIYFLEEFISYSEIDSITFLNHDFLGSFDRKKILFPSVSIGVQNKIIIKTRTNKMYESQFQMKHDNELIRIEKYFDQNQIVWKWLAEPSDF